ncbi:MAG: NADH-quinone oxidoreductase subunit NuoE [Peptococcaceae bacterium]|nr:NADH-quinone oxidoreductase subunit NuoE [Peptococcaceae bacterium]
MCQSCGKGHKDLHVDLKQIKLKEKIDAYRGEAGSLIPVLQEAQDIYGYLPEETMKMVAKEMKIPVAEVFGVATFYSQFRFTPTGRNVIRVCMGTACHVRGGLKVLKALERELDIKAGETTGDGKFTLETVACIGACGLAPVISINNKVFGNLTSEMVPGILEKFE